MFSVHEEEKQYHILRVGKDQNPWARKQPLDQLPNSLKIDKDKMVSLD